MHVYASLLPEHSPLRSQWLGMAEPSTPIANLAPPALHTSPHPATPPLPPRHPAHHATLGMLCCAVASLHRALQSAWGLHDACCAAEAQRDFLQRRLAAVTQELQEAHELLQCVLEMFFLGML